MEVGSASSRIWYLKKGGLWYLRESGMKKVQDGDSMLRVVHVGVGLDVDGLLLSYHWGLRTGHVAV